METRANYFLVGCFVLALLAGIFAAGMWFARAQLTDENTYYYTYFRGAVTGLSVGSVVRYRGVPVGTVSDIAIDDQNVELIQVTLALRPETPVRTDTVAGLQPQGITGLSFIQLSGGTQGAEPLRPRAGKRRAVIQSVPSPIDKIIEDAPLVVARLADLADRLTLILSDNNVQSIDRLLENSAEAAAGLARAMAGAEGLVDDAKGTLKGLDRTMADAGRLAVEARGLVADAQSLMGTAQRTIRDAGTMTPQAAAAIDEVRRAAGGFGRVADQFEKLAAATRPGVEDFGRSGLYELQQFMIEGRALITTLNRVVANFERDPARFLFGDQQKGIEAK
ncbi:MAG: MCE family protein [Rhodospirillales bacterium]|nr:MCE family protein [Rhodospirillales bacterium]